MLGTYRVAPVTNIVNIVWKPQKGLLITVQPVGLAPEIVGVGKKCVALKRLDIFDTPNTICRK
jgi:hypothetical protein